MRINQGMVKILVMTLIGMGLGIGGIRPTHGAYSLMKLPAGARQAALGGVNLVIPDLNSALDNPALLGISSENELGFNYLSFYESLTLSSLATRFHYRQIGLSCGIINHSIQDIEFYPDHPTERPQSKFDAHQMLAFFGTGFAVGSQAWLGFTSKFVYQKIYRYDAHAIAFDIGMIVRPERLSGVTLGLGYQNFGFSSQFQDEKLKLPESFGMGAGYDWRISDPLSLITSINYRTGRAQERWSWGNEIRFGKWINLLISLHSDNDIDQSYSLGTQINLKSYSVIIGYTPTSEPFNEVTGISLIKKL